MNPDHSSLLYAAADRKHRPASHPVLRGLPRPYAVEEPNEPDWIAFGTLVRARRRAKGWSQDRLGSIVGVSGPAVHFWETGATHPSDKHLQALSEALGSLR